jgi:hypothetical protein
VLTRASASQPPPPPRTQEVVTHSVHHLSSWDVCGVFNRCVARSLLVHVCMDSAYEVAPVEVAVAPRGQVAAVDEVAAATAKGHFACATLQKHFEHLMWS